MTNSSLNISGKLDLPTVELYRAVDSAVHAIRAKYLIVGASARDLVFQHGYGIRIVRATTDTDYGIQVNDWDQFEQLRETLMDKGFQNHAFSSAITKPNWPQVGYCSIRWCGG